MGRSSQGVRPSLCQPSAMPLTHAQLENPSDLFATAARAVLLADAPAWPIPVYDQRDAGKSNTARTDVRASGFARASDHMDWANVNGNAVPFYNHRMGVLSFEVITPATYRGEIANANIHAQCVGRIGYLCDRVAQQFTTTVCSGLVVLDIRDQGIAHTQDQKTDADHSTRNFEIEYLIPGEVYSAAT